MTPSPPRTPPNSKKLRVALALSLGANVVFLAPFSRDEASGSPGLAPTAKSMVARETIPTPRILVPPPNFTGIPSRPEIHDLPAAADDVQAETPAPPLLENLSREKWDELQSIAADYGELAEKIYRRSNGLIAPADRAQLALLEKEKHADLAALLAPEELDAYQRRAADTARLYRR